MVVGKNEVKAGRGWEEAGRGGEWKTVGIGNGEEEGNKRRTRTVGTRRSARGGDETTKRKRYRKTRNAEKGKKGEKRGLSTRRSKEGK